MAEFLTREAILAAEDVKFEVVEVPEWGGSVRVRGLSGTERGRFEALVTSDDSKRRSRGTERRKIDLLASVTSRLCAKCIVDESGKRLFSDHDVEQLGAKSAAAIGRVSEVAMRLSGLSGDDVDELAEAMASDPFDGSSSA